MDRSDPGAGWHLEADFGTSRVLVRMVERDGRFGIRVRLDAEGYEPVIFSLTPDQAGFLGEALPAILAMLRIRQEQRDWELSMQDPFADFDNPGGPPVGKDRGDASDDRRAGPGLGHDRAAPEEIRDAAAQPSAQPAPMSAEGSSSSVAAIEDAPVPKRRGASWSAAEEARLVEAHQAGQGVSHLATLLQRSPRAIRKRLEKLELVAVDR